MSKNISKATERKYISRYYRKRRIRKTVVGTAERPRLNIFRSDKHFLVQLIDDDNGHTLLQVSTMSKDIRGKIKANVEGAKIIGKLIAEKALKNKITQVVFDRNGYKFHGSIKTLADSARESGLKF